MDCWYSSQPDPSKLLLTVWSDNPNSNPRILSSCLFRSCKWPLTSNRSWRAARYRITGYLWDSEICAFWPKRAILNVCRSFFNAWLYMGCGYPILDINYFIFVRFHFYSLNNYYARINNRLYGNSVKTTSQSKYSSIIHTGQIFHMPTLKFLKK